MNPRPSHTSAVSPLRILTSARPPPVRERVEAACSRVRRAKRTPTASLAGKDLVATGGWWVPAGADG